MSNGVLVVNDVVQLLVDVTNQKVLEIAGANQVLEIQVAGLQGPSSEELMPFAEQTDFVGDTLIYRGYAVPGALVSNPVWRIKQITIATDGDVSIKWPSGDAGFTRVWADRASYGYV